MLLLLACNQAPVLQITSPGDGDPFLAGSLLHVEVSIQDDKSDPAQMSWRWRLGDSELEGELTTGAASAQFEATAWAPEGEQLLWVHGDAVEDAVGKGAESIDRDQQLQQRHCKQQPAP